MNKYYLVTGGAGFIGSHVVDLLLKNNKKVKVIDNLSCGSMKNLLQHKNNKNLLFKKLDIRKIKKNEKFLKNCQRVIHLAGIGDIVPSINYPKNYYETNVTGTLNLLEYFKDKNIDKFVYAASSSCYGKALVPTKEDNKINTLHPYALSKYMGEQLCLHWHNIYDFPVNSIRIFNAYGTRSKTSGAYGAVIGVFLKQILMNKPLTVVGDGKQKRDFLFVTDVAQAFYKASVTQFKGKIWNLGNGEAHTVNYLIKNLKYKRKVFIPDRPGEPRVTLADTTKIRKDLNWKPKVSFEKGIGIILKNINYWKNAPLWTKGSIKQATKDWFKYIK